MRDKVSALTSRQIVALAKPFSAIDFMGREGLKIRLQGLAMHFVYELARKSEGSLGNAYGFSPDEIAQAKSLLGELGLTLGMEIAPDTLAHIQHKTHRRPAPSPRRASGRSSRS